MAALAVARGARLPKKNGEYESQQGWFEDKDVRAFITAACNDVHEWLGLFDCYEDGPQYPDIIQQEGADIFLRATYNGGD